VSIYLSFLSCITRKYKKNGHNPDGFTFYNYAAVEVWAQAVQKTKTTTSKAVIKVMKSNTFSTVLGDVTFNKKGDISEPGFVMYGFFDGEPDYIQ